MNRVLPFLLLPALALAGCAGTAPAPAEGQGGLAAEVASFHGGKAWGQKRAYRAKIEVAFGKRPPLRGVLLYAPHQNKVRFDLEDGTTLVFDGERAWAAPKAFPRARFHLLTWPYFIAAPFKLGDPGTKLVEVGEHALAKGQDPLRVGRLTFGAGVGDTPDDWYDVYASPEGRLEALGYIVTYGKEAAEAEQAPHACVYSEFVEVEGVLLAQSYRFYDWTRAGGIVGEPLGRVTLSEVSYVTPTKGDFSKPAGAVEDALPK